MEQVLELIATVGVRKAGLHGDAHHASKFQFVSRCRRHVHRADHVLEVVQWRVTLTASVLLVVVVVMTLITDRRVVPSC